MRYGLLILALGFFMQAWAQEEPDQWKFTQRALMSYKLVRDKSKELGDRLEAMTLGEHTEKLLYLTPFIDGRLRFEFDNFRVKLNTRKEKGSIQFVYKF